MTNCFQPCCLIGNADTPHTLGRHSNTLHITSLHLAISHRLFSCTASNSPPHSVIWLYGLVAANRRGGTDGDNLPCAVESFIFHTGCKNNSHSCLIELLYHVAPANMSCSALQMESRPKYYGREWVWLTTHIFMPLLSNITLQTMIFLALLLCIRCGLGSSGWMCIVCICVSLCFGKSLRGTSKMLICVF